ncbi:MAG: arginyltransferase [Planctomycetaceae bacterium]|nr:arginyltransferase [Planctomycetaceae bacterium]
MPTPDGRFASDPILSIVSPNEPCAYLPSVESNYEIRIIAKIGDRAYDAMLSRGWRRQGAYFFRPACKSCRQCKSLRVDVSAFQATKSQRRCWKRNRGIRIEIAEPSPCTETVALFNAYHADMTKRRGWPKNEVNLETFATHFLIGDFSFAREFRYYQDSQLVGIGLVDITQQSASSIYFFHDPNWRSQGPGVFSMLAEIEHATKSRIPYHYLGYWISDCPSMSYKDRYRPNQILESYVPDETQPVWLPHPASDLPQYR